MQMRPADEEPQLRNSCPNTAAAAVANASAPRTLQFQNKRAEEPLLVNKRTIFSAARASARARGGRRRGAALYKRSTAALRLRWARWLAR